MQIIATLHNLFYIANKIIIIVWAQLPLSIADILWAIEKQNLACTSTIWNHAYLRFKYCKLVVSSS